MKNTEYKNVFDVGEEALSIKNKFSFNKSVQFQNTLGETVRGMRNVSPILQVKPTSVDSQFIQNHYFIDATKKDKDNEILIDEIKFMKRDGYSFVFEEFFEDTNQNGVFGDVGDLLDFKLLIFASEDGNKIREAHNVVQQKADEIILFLESDSDLLTGKARLYAKIGSNIRKKFFDKDGNLTNNALTEKIQSKKNDIETKTLIELLETGTVKGNIISIENFMNTFKNQFLNMLAFNYILGTIIDSAAEKIDFLKVPDNFWDADNPDYFFDKDNLLENLTISGDQITKLENLLIGTGIVFSGPFAPLVPITMKILAPKLRPIAKSWIDSYNQYITKIIEEVFVKIDNNPLSDFLLSEAQKQIAFECGIWNGIVDFISSFFKFIALVLKSPSSAVEDPALTLETLDNIFDFLSGGEVLNTFRTELSQFCKDLVQDLHEQGTDDINWTKVFYIIGFVAMFVATFFIPFANIVKVLGSAGKFGEIFTIFMKTFEDTLKIVKAAVNSSTKNITRFLVKGGQKAIAEFLAFFKSEGRLRKFFDNIRKKIVEWFKKKGKNYEEFKSKVKEKIKKYLKKTKFPIYKTIKVVKKYIGEETGHGWCAPKAVKYLDEIERLDYEIAIIDGKLYTKNGKLFDTTFAGEGRIITQKAIFVMDKEGRIFATNAPERYYFHHSSFLAGGEVAAAGEIKVSKGIVEFVSKQSGHYQPSAKYMKQFMKQLEVNGTDVNKIIVEF